MVPRHSAEAPIERLAVLRLDGDLYESTIQCWSPYDKLSVGGYVIVDDYATWPLQEGRARLSGPTRNQRSDPADRLGGGVYWGAHSWIKPTLRRP